MSSQSSACRKACAVCVCPAQSTETREFVQVVPCDRSEDWSEPTPRGFPIDPPITIHAGNHITYACTFQNRTDKTIVQGLSATTNEMCILHCMYWPRAIQSTEECFMGKSSSDEPSPLPHLGMP